MVERDQRRYGLWSSPLSAAMLAQDRRLPAVA